MGTTHKQKRPPERSCPRGAEDNLLIRERLDATGTLREGERTRGGLCFEARCQHPCRHNRSVVRRTSGPVSRSSQCRPIHGGSRCILCAKALTASACSASPPVNQADARLAWRFTTRFDSGWPARGCRVANRLTRDGRENMQMADEGQGRFFRWGKCAIGPRKRVHLAPPQSCRRTAAQPNSSRTRDFCDLFLRCGIVDRLCAATVSDFCAAEAGQPIGERP